jgi:hypothetical protein
MAKNDSFFNEIYGTYFNVVSSILRQAQEKQLTKDSLELLVREQAFADSCLTIPKALQDGSWPLLQKDMTTPLRHAPAMPLTTLQRRWLKSLLTDKRLQLFDVDCSGLEDVEPLFSEEQFVYFDRYSDGDNYDAPQYKQHFRLLLQAITEKRRVEISFISGKNESVWKEYLPLQLEYSAKDDKFRLKAVCERHLHYVNVGRIKSCRLLEQTGEEACMLLEPERCAVTVLLTDERNALERAMLHFSHLEKITERLDEKHYRLQLMYNKSDETEMVIRILSFGPLLRVQEPAGFIELLRCRLRKQLALIVSGVPVIVLATQMDVYDKTVSNLQEVKAREAVVIAIGFEGDTSLEKYADHVIYIPRTDKYLAPLMAVLPLQLLAYYAALTRGCDVDKPRNLAKSVTVE